MKTIIKWVKSPIYVSDEDADNLLCMTFLGIVCIVIGVMC